MEYQACVIGHVTKDRICIPGRADHELPGGTAFYVSRAWAALGLRVSVITKVAEEDDAALLGDLRDRGIHVVNRGSARTTVFENRYSGAHLSHREQRVLSVADPFEASDLAGLSAEVLHVGPLTRAEVPLALYPGLRAVAPRVGLDGQGLLRVVEDAAVRLAPADDLQAVLPYVDVLKVDDLEAEIMVGPPGDPEAAAAALAGFGVAEVLMTFADQGSAIRWGGASVRIPAVPPVEEVDATGCGDTFVAAYLYARLVGRGPEASAHFAAAAASLKLSHYGPFEGTAAQVDQHGGPGGW
jgi:sugar/nucleoside kinase (ribokinase family)